MAHEKEPPALTVGRLRELLVGVDDALEVELEGCDCCGGLAGILVSEDGVLLRRTDQVQQHEYDRIERETLSPRLASDTPPP